jgi:hypothetical protein
MMEKEDLNVMSWDDESSGGDFGNHVGEGRKHFFLMK